MKSIGNIAFKNSSQVQIEILSLAVPFAFR